MQLKRIAKIVVVSVLAIVFVAIISLTTIAVETHLDNVAKTQPDNQFSVFGLYQGQSLQTRVVFFVPWYWYGRWSVFWDRLNFTSVVHTWFCISQSAQDPGQCYTALGHWNGPEPQRGHAVHIMSDTGRTRDVRIRDVTIGYVFFSQ